MLDPHGGIFQKTPEFCGQPHWYWITHVRWHHLSPRGSTVNLQTHSAHLQCNHSNWGVCVSRELMKVPGQTVWKSVTSQFEKKKQKQKKNPWRGVLGLKVRSFLQAVRWHFSCGSFSPPLVGASGVALGSERSGFELIGRKDLTGKWAEKAASSKECGLVLVNLKGL